MSQPAALHAYRTLLRASLLTFRNDERVLTAARQRIRDEFKKAKDEADPEKIKSLLGAAHDNARFLLDQVVQAPLAHDTKQPVYRVVLSPTHAQLMGAEGKIEAPVSRQQQQAEAEKPCCGGCSEFKE